MSRKCRKSRAGRLRNRQLPGRAILVIDEEIIATGYNEYTRDNPEQRSYVNHAENLLIIKNGIALSDAYKQGKTISLYSTLEPCIQCLGASVTNHVNRILYIESDPNGGACNIKHDNIGLWYKEFWPEIIHCPVSEEPKKMMIDFFRNEVKRGHTEWPEKMLRLYGVN